MAGAGGLDPIQTMLTSSIDYALWHVEDTFLKQGGSQPIRGSFRETKDVNVESLPEYPNTGNNDGMYGMKTRNMSSVQRKLPPGITIPPKETTAGSKEYTIDPLKKGNVMDTMVQKGHWQQANDPYEPPALGRSWEWRRERNVGNSFSETAFTYDRLHPGSKKPTWGMHFGQIDARPTFGRIRCISSAHQATPSLVGDMSMDKQIFSPFRTTSELSRSMPPSRSATPDVSLVSGQSSRQSRRSRLQTSESKRIDANRAETPAKSDSFVMAQPSDLMSIISDRVASPPSTVDETTVLHARSCSALDGIERSLIVLPPKWAHIKHLIKDEFTAKKILVEKTKVEVLKEAPKNILHYMHAQYRSHPDSSWQPNCFPVAEQQSSQVYRDPSCRSPQAGDTKTRWMTPPSIPGVEGGPKNRSADTRIFRFGKASCAYLCPPGVKTATFHPKVAADLVDPSFPGGGQAIY